MSMQLGKMVSLLCISEKGIKVINPGGSTFLITIFKDTKNSLPKSTSPIGRRRQSRNNKKLTEAVSVATEKGIRDEVIDQEEVLTKTHKKDCVDMLIEEALDDHDFPKLRSILHMLGYGIPENEINELEVPPEWNSALDTDDLELTIEEEDNEEQSQSLLNQHFTDLNKPKDWEEPRGIIRTLQLEFAIRKQLTPLIRIILCAYGHNIPFKDDGPSGQGSLYGYLSDPLP